MKKIIKDRGRGKTTDLIKIAASSGGYIVCTDQNEAARINSKAIEFGFDITFPITFDEFLQKRYYGRGIKCFLIDNADILLQSLTHVEIKAITMTEDQTNTKSDL